MLQLLDCVATPRGSDVEIFSIPFSHAHVAVSGRNPFSLTTTPHDIADARQAWFLRYNDDTVSH